MSIAIQQNQQSEIQVYTKSEKACKDQIVRWLDEIDPFSSDQLHQTARGLCEISLKNLQVHAREFTANRIAESKELCHQQQREVTFDKRLLIQSIGKGVGALGGGTGCSLAAVGSAGIFAMGAIGTGGALCVLFLGSDCLRTYQRSHPEIKKRALIQSAHVYKSTINHLSNRIQCALDHRIEVARIQRNLDGAAIENATLRRSCDQVNETANKLRDEIKDARSASIELNMRYNVAKKMIDLMRADLDCSRLIASELRADLERANLATTEVRSHLKRANQVTEGLRADLKAANLVTAGLRSDLDIANVASATFRKDLSAANAATQSLRHDVDTVKKESKNSQFRLEEKIEALISAMDGNSTSKSVSNLMHSKSVPSPTARLAAERNEVLDASQQNDPQDEEFIYVSNTTEGSFADERASTIDEQLLTPQDVASNYHLARADQQITSSRKLH